MHRDLRGAAGSDEQPTRHERKPDAPAAQEIPTQQCIAEGRIGRHPRQGRVVDTRVAQDGIQLSSDNAVKVLALSADVDRRALFKDTRQTALGRVELEKLQVVRVVQLLTAL
jgi:hypothetical protein